MLISRADGIVNMSEMKYAKGEYAIDAEDDRKITSHAEAFAKAIGGGKPIHVTLVTTCGFAH